jgi:hypothetical protein
MADDFRAYRGVVPSGGVMSALPKAEPTDQEQAYLDAYLADQRRRYVKDDFRAPAPGPSTMDSIKGGAKGLFESMSLFNLVPEAARAAYSGFTLPGDALRGKAPPVNLPDGSINPAAIERSMDFAGLVTLGAGAVPAQANTLRAGMSFPPDGKRMFGGVMRTEEEIAKLEARGLTDQELLARRAARGPETEAKKQRKFEQTGLATMDIPLPLKTRGDGLYSKAEQALLQFKQPNATVAEYIGFLKQRGVKEAELKALGLDKMNPDEVLSSKGIQDLVVARTPKLDRVELTGSQTRHSQWTEKTESPSDYREIVYRLPPEYTASGPVPPKPDYGKIYDEVSKEFPEKTDSEITDIAVGRANDIQKQRYDKLFTVPSHWGTMENPLFHIRATDYMKGNQKVFKVQEGQGDWGQQKSMLERGKMRGSNKPIPDAPYVDDDKWVDLLGIKTIVEAVNSGADKIELVPGVVHARRWEEPKLQAFYDEKYAGAIDRALKQAGAPVGYKVKEPLGYNRIQASEYLERIPDEDLLDRFALRVGTGFSDNADDYDIWETSRYGALQEVEDPGYLKDQLDRTIPLSKRLTDRLDIKNRELANLEKELADKYGGGRQLNRQEYTDMIDMRGVASNLKYEIREETQRLQSMRNTIYAYQTVAPQLTKELDTKFKSNTVPRYFADITDDLREFVKNKGWAGFAKGGIVDLFNYMAWS